MRRCTLCCGGLGLALLAIAPVVEAQPGSPGTQQPAAEPAAAEELFNQGLEAMLAERYAEGCPKLEQSFHLDPLPGAEFTLAECLAKWGKIGSALGHYQAFVRRASALPAAQRVGQAQRLGVAKTQVKALQPKVPVLVLKLPAEAPVGTVVKLDGATVDQLEAPQPVDPGEHRLLVELPSGELRAQTATVAEAERREVTLELPAGASLHPEPEPESGGLGPVRISALVVGGLGVASLVVFGVTGGLALGQKSTVQDNCNDHRCNHDGKLAADRGQTYAAASTATLVIGIAAVAAGVVLWLVAPPEPEKSAAPTDEQALGSTVRLTSPGVADDPGAITLGIQWNL
jgi:hypothetical protein